MKCKVCGAESGKYPLCRACNIKKEKGEIIKCENCKSWHHIGAPCSVSTPTTDDDKYLYDVRRTLISQSEQSFYIALKSCVPDGFFVFPQINLASFISRTDDARFHNELFRNVDFLVTNAEFKPQFIVEINDHTHLNNDRRERDEKVKKICEEAGIPILMLWTSYGVNQKYIKERIDDILNNLPIARVHHFSQASTPPQTLDEDVPLPPIKKKNGCYIATCVYGSYDCPQVWMLRRFRDDKLAPTWYGKMLIRIYYAISPSVVRLFSNNQLVKSIWKYQLDKIITKLQSQGIKDSPYSDKQ